MKDERKKLEMTAKELAAILRVWTRENLVGLTTETEGGFSFYLPGGRTFQVTVLEEK